MGGVRGHAPDAECATTAGGVRKVVTFVGRAKWGLFAVGAMLGQNWQGRGAATGEIAPSNNVAILVGAEPVSDDPFLFFGTPLIRDPYRHTPLHLSPEQVCGSGENFM
jgi:hypothetical protein